MRPLRDRVCQNDNAEGKKAPDCGDFAIKSNKCPIFARMGARVCGMCILRAFSGICGGQITNTAKIMFAPRVRSPNYRRDYINWRVATLFAIFSNRRSMARD